MSEMNITMMVDVRRGIDNSSPQTSAPRSSESSNSEDDPDLQLGRPSKWTPSRRRKLIRLYLFSKLSTEEIAAALQEHDWVPGDESTKKTVSSLLDKQPRWLRPKNKGEIDERVAGLSECKTRRKTKRRFILPHKLTTPSAFATPESILDTHYDNYDIPSDIISDESRQEWRFGGLNYQNDVEESVSTWDLKTLFPEEYFDSEGVLPTIGEELETTIANDHQSLSTYWSTSSLGKRLPKHSSRDLKGIMRLMKAYSISNSSAATTNRTAFTVRPAKYDCPSLLSKANTSVDEVAGPLLADSLLVADWYKQKQGLCIPGLIPHDLKACWCAVTEELKSNCQTWSDSTWASGITTAGPVLFDLNLALHDDFGNTALHFLAARGASMAMIINAIERGADPNAKNTANQSFLHVFPAGFLNELAQRPYELDHNLQKLHGLGVKLYDRDHLGRTPFHNLPWQTMKTYPHSLAQIARQLSLPTSRDALGYIPSQYLPSPDFPGPGPILAPPDSATWIMRQTRLLKNATLAFAQPRIQDLEGRNGLQCLAEASLTMIINKGKIQPIMNRKRKRNQPVADQPAPRLTLRYELVQKMIDAGVDINHFDKRGNTVLIAFITHLPDGEDDKILRILLNYLIDKGANIHYRNRRGETALHVAIRLGRKVATTTLLQNGANIHARTIDDKGVLVVGEKAYFDAKDIANQQLYASILACIAIAFQYHAVPGPTLVQEWSVKEGFATYIKLQNSLAKGGVKKAPKKRKEKEKVEREEVEKEREC